ncbi:MAG: tyrosine--tRNA ligase [Bacteroidetes bacterium]|nr:tyrosine--tRNA ligase [Bacteroidota bacterium]MCW5895282.1 tyrosine--tRNA ligase [Bacteroidota bacterium]
MDIIRRGAAEVIPEEALVQKIEHSLKTQVPLRVKLGCDPSRPDLHLGHSVVLRKLRHFQDIGHQAILIVGDFTGMIGDPSGRNKTRPTLTLEETRKNGQSYFEQAMKILSTKKVQMLYNSEWLGKMSFADVISLASKYTVARMLERDEFEKRFKAQEPISVHEFLYPLAQAMDSVAVAADIELGGTDQKFNLLVGRDIQREYGLHPQVAVTLPILPGTDGVEKMSKSLDNFIGINEPAKEIFGKTLSIPDSLIYDYFVLATDVSLTELGEIRSLLSNPKTNPRDVKRRLARTLVAMYHSEEAAQNAQEEFDRIFVKKDVPDEIHEATIQTENGSVGILKLLTDTKLVASNGEARRMIEQGGVSIDGVRIDSDKAVVTIRTGVIVKVGKRKFLKVIKAE